MNDAGLVESHPGENDDEDVEKDCSLNVVLTHERESVKLDEWRRSAYSRFASESVLYQKGNEILKVLPGEKDRLILEYFDIIKALRAFPPLSETKISIVPMTLVQIDGRMQLGIREPFIKGPTLGDLIDDEYSGDSEYWRRVGELRRNADLFLRLVDECTLGSHEFILTDRRMGGESPGEAYRNFVVPENAPVQGQMVNVDPICFERLDQALTRREIKQLAMVNPSYNDLLERLLSSAAVHGLLTEVRRRYRGHENALERGKTALEELLHVLFNNTLVSVAFADESQGQKTLVISAHGDTRGMKEVGRILVPAATELDHLEVARAIVREFLERREAA